MSTSRQWPDGPAKPLLGDRETHVWVAGLDLAPLQIDLLRGTMPQDERSRVDRSARTVKRDRHTAAHGILRDVLARYCACSPNAVAFDVGPHGKPMLAVSMQNDALRFNLSHSGECAMYAVANGPEVGIDIEIIRERTDITKIAESFFALQEVAALREMPASKQTDAFYACWTRKEAYIKALGMGLSYPLDSFQVCVEPEVRSGHIHTTLDPDDEHRWTLINVTPCAGYAAALVVEKPQGKVRYWRWAGTAT